MALAVEAAGRVPQRGGLGVGLVLPGGCSPLRTSPTGWWRTLPSRAGSVRPSRRLAGR